MGAAFAVLVALHVGCALVGFGSVALSGVYGGIARRLDRPDARDDASRWFAKPNRAKWAVLGVPVFGVAALLADHRLADFAHPWVGSALAVWAVAATVVIHVVAPAERHLRAALAPPPACSTPGAPSLPAAPAAPAPAGAATRLLVGTAVCDVAFAVALGLMVWQP